jgi:hypothetical protein
LPLHQYVIPTSEKVNWPAVKITLTFPYTNGKNLIGKSPQTNNQQGEFVMKREINPATILTFLTTAITAQAGNNAQTLIKELKGNQELQTQAAQLMFASCMLSDHTGYAYEYIELMAPGAIRNACCVEYIKRLRGKTREYSSAILETINLMTAGTEKNEIIRWFLPLYIKINGHYLSEVYKMRAAIGSPVKPEELRAWVDKALVTGLEFFLEDLVELLEGKQRVQICQRIINHLIKAGDLDSANNFADLRGSPLTKAEVDLIIKSAIEQGGTEALVSCLKQRKRKLRSVEEKRLFRVLAEKELRAETLLYLDRNPKSANGRDVLLIQLTGYFVDMCDLENAQQAAKLRGEKLASYQLERIAKGAFEKGEIRVALDAMTALNDPRFTALIAPSLYDRALEKHYHSVADRIAKFVIHGPETEDKTSES